MSSFLEARRARVAASLPLGDAILLVGAGEPTPLPEDSDQTYPFRSHAEYFYLAGRECAGGVIAFDRRNGDCDGWISFVPPVTEAERIWEGRAQLAGTPIHELPAWLSSRRERTVAALGAPVRHVRSDTALTAHVRAEFTHIRRSK